MPGINMLHANSKTEALLAIAKRCHAQGLHAEADRWRECAFLYAAELSSPENRPLKVLCDDGDPLCGQSA